MLITCFASCLEMWDLIWEMRFRFVLCLRLFETIRSRDHAWSSHRQFCWSFNLIFLTNDACLFSIIEWRIFVLDLSSDVYDETSLNLTKHLIKLIVSDSSNLMSENVISSNLTKTTHQTFEKKDSFSTFWWAKTSAATLDVKNLVLQKILFCVKINVCMRLLW
jgi:hypothetical protein